MGSRLDRFRTIFRREILPHFPESGERFERYFRHSCDLIAEMPIITSKDLAHYHPERANGHTPGSLSVWLFNLDVGLVALGLKPLALCGKVFAPYMRNMAKDLRSSMMIREAGLDLRSANDGQIEVYDPAMICRMMRKHLKLKVEPSGVYDVLANLDFRRVISGEDYPYYLLGYPEKHRKGRQGWEEEKEMFSGSRGFLRHPEMYYVSHFACKMYDAETNKKTLRARASAAALIEDIRRSPPEIESFAMIRTPALRGGNVVAGVGIKRLEGEAGIWQVQDTMGP